MFSIFKTLRFTVLSKKIFTGVLATYISLGAIALSAVPVPAKQSNSAYPIETLINDPKAKTLLIELRDKCLSLADQVEETIKRICSATEKLYLRRFLNNNKPTLNKLAGIIGQAIEQSIQNTGLATRETRLMVDGVSITITPNDYKTIKTLVLKIYTDSCKNVGTPNQTKNNTPSTTKDALIQELLTNPIFNKIRINLITPFVAHATTTLNIKTGNFEQTIMATIKQLLIANLNESEITELLNLFKSNAVQRIILNGNEFVKIILADLSPGVVAHLQQIFPWLTVA